MILLVFEGERREPEIFKTIEELFFDGRKDRIICSYGNNIYDLYETITEQGQLKDERYYQDVVSVLKEKYRQDDHNPIHRIKDPSEVSETYLFFDYDIQNQNYERTLSFDDLNARISALLSFFTDETRNGKLYVSYPMIEALRYTKKLPDNGYHGYVFPLSDIKDFKEEAHAFSYYKNLDFVSFRFGKGSGEVTASDIKRKPELWMNWISLIDQNTRKANFICNDDNSVPDKVDVISQKKIMDSQLKKYYPREVISILSAFPLFVFDYFGRIPQEGRYFNKLEQL